MRGGGGGRSSCLWRMVAVFGVGVAEETEWCLVCVPPLWGGASLWAVPLVHYVWLCAVSECVLVGTHFL